jgi:hypothetical protein
VKAGAEVNALDVRQANFPGPRRGHRSRQPEDRELLLAKGAVREPALDWVRRYQYPAILPLFV